MYGDPAEIRSLAVRLEQHAEQLRDHATTLGARASSAAGEGLAAAALIARVAARTAALRRAAHRHDAAAEALRRHADQVEWLLEQIARAERRFTDLVSAARERIGRVASLGGLITIDPRDESLLRLRPPPSGDRGWLELDLPGLR